MPSSMQQMTITLHQTGIDLQLDQMKMITGMDHLTHPQENILINCRNRDNQVGISEAEGVGGYSYIFRS